MTGKMENNNDDPEGRCSLQAADNTRGDSKRRRAMAQATVQPESTLASGERRGYGPLRLSEVVLKTSEFERLRDWYRNLLGFEPFFERTPPPPAPGETRGSSRASDMRMAFFRLHIDYPYTQILGVF